MSRKVIIEWSACENYTVTFIRWQRMRCHCGGKDTNSLGIGALVYSDWLFRPPLFNRKQRDYLLQGYSYVRPYHDLFLDDPHHYEYPRKLKRPTLKEYNQLLKRRKK